MTIQQRVDSAPALNPFSFVSPQDTPENLTLSGAYGGESVQRLDVSSLVQNAAEELTFGFSERTEKSLKERKMGGIDSQSLRERIEELQQALPDLPDGEAFEALVEELRRQSPSDAGEILDHVGKLSRDPSHQFLLLELLRDTLDAEEAPPELRAAVRGALERLQTEQGPNIRAGINIAQVAKDGQKAGLADVQSLRDFYRDTLVRYPGLNGTYGALLEQFGDENLDRGLSFLMQAAGADLAATQGSREPAALKATLDDLFRLHVLTGLREGCGDLAKRLGVFGIRPDAPVQLLGQLLTLSEKTWIHAQDIAVLPAVLGVRGIEGEINFLREFKALSRLIPLKAFTQVENREKLLDAIQGALDDAINREEASLS
ncbi:MAG: type III secretion system gatekeeper subunit SctW [Pseudomonadota bacterium]